MAKVKLSALFQSIRGSVGEQTFYPQKGRGIIVRQKNVKTKTTHTQMQVKMRTALAQNSSKWRDMTIKQRMWWGFYANYLNDARKKIGAPMRKQNYNNMRAIDAYLAINQLLAAVEFETIVKPPHEKLTDPPTPLTNIEQDGAYEKEIKFLIQLPHSYQPHITGQNAMWEGLHSTEKESVPAKAQIFIKTCRTGAYIYTLQPAPNLTDKPLEIKIDKIKVIERVKGIRKTVELQTKQIKHVIMQIQMRTIAQNGKFSPPSPLYTIEIINP